MVEDYELQGFEEAIWGDSSELRRYSHLVPVVLDCEDNQLPFGYD